MEVKGMKRQSGSAFVGLIAAMVIIYLVVLMFSLRGWGYMGYGGYHRGPSFMYWGGPDIHHSRSNRDGSTGGPNNRGGGHSGGK